MFCNENIKIDWNHDMEAAFLAFNEANKKRYPTYITIDSKGKMETTSDKGRALSFTKISNIIKTILSDQNVSIARKKEILEEFIIIKKKFSLKKLGFFTRLFFQKRKDAQIKVASTIIKQSIAQLGLENEFATKFNNRAAQILLEAGNYHIYNLPRKYIKINSITEEVEQTSNKRESLSFEKVSNLIKNILFDPNVIFSLKTEALDGFTIIKNNFELKKLNRWTHFFFGKKKEAQIKEATKIIEQGYKQILTEKAKLKEKANSIGVEIAELIKKRVSSQSEKNQLRQKFKEIKSILTRLEEFSYPYVNYIKIEKKLIEKIYNNLNNDLENIYTDDLNEKEIEIELTK